jgi:hypothetical protein
MMVNKEFEVEKSICDITLRFWGAELEPKDITACLKLEPTKYQVAGDSIVSKHGRAKISKQGFWSFKCKNKSSLDVTNRLKEFLTRLDNSGSKLAKINGVEGIVLTIFIGIEDSEDSLEFTLSPKIMKGFSELGIDISVTIL